MTDIKKQKMAQVNKEVIAEAYSFTIDIQGEVIALVPGNMGFVAYEPTGIIINGDSLAIWKLGREALKKEDPEAELSYLLYQENSVS